MGRIITIIVGLAVLGFIGYGLTARREGPAPSSPTGEMAELRPAPNFSLKDYAGNTVSRVDFRGKPVMVNSWASWCPFCREELKDFAAFQREFGDRVAIIAIDRAESLETAKRYSDELGVTDDLIFLLDPSDSFYQSIGGFSMPETIFVDADGKIIFHKRGPMKTDEIRQRVKDAFGL